MPISGYFDTIFAVSGDLATVPDESQPDGSVSYTVGYGPDYSLPNTDPSFRNPERNKMNKLFYDITSALQQYQQHGTPPFITTAMNGGTPYSYSANDMCLLSGVIYRSLVNSNTDTPPSSKWIAASSVVSQAFTASGTYTPTVGMSYCIAEVWGAGGGGGGVTAVAGAAGGGGGAGGYSRKVISAATIGASKAVTIGAGGTAGANTGGNGGTGGTSSLGAIMSATGGTGGTGTTSAAITTGAGQGGVGTGGDINAKGMSGFRSTIGGTSVSNSGAGGSTSLGGNGTSANNVAGFDGTANSGSGGSGAASGGTALIGGVGGSGYVVITEFCFY